MFAVIRTGGKQYRVTAGDRLAVEKIPAEAGEIIEISEVLMLGGDEIAIGTPLVDGATVRAEVVEQTRGPKVISFKKRRRKHGSKTLRGHRQQLTLIEITEILSAGAKPKKATKKADKKPAAKAETKTAAVPAESEAAPKKAAAKKPAAKKAAPKKTAAKTDGGGKAAAAAKAAKASKSKSTTKPKAADDAAGGDD